MAPYNFDAPDSDIILRSSDGKEYPVHRLILGLASLVFQGMFRLPQPNESGTHVDVPESSDILQPFLQYLYPQSPPKVSDLAMWAALYTVAEKYDAEVVMDLLKNMLIPRFLETSPLRVYALAAYWGFKEVMKIASTRTLTIDVYQDFPREDAELMGGVACQQLYHLHIKRRIMAHDLITDHPLPSPSSPCCSCLPPDYSALITALCQRVAKRPWLTTEELYKEVGTPSNVYPIQCSAECRNAFKNMHVYFTSLLKGISELPQTID